MAFRESMKNLLPAFLALSLLVNFALMVSIYANFIMFKESSPFIVRKEIFPPKFKCAIVLGASVRGDKLSGALLGRMRTAVTLFQNGTVSNLFVSGYTDGGYYDETKAMLNYAQSNNVPAKDIFVDNEGHSTMESLSRAKNVFLIQEAIIVTQESHLQRAVWLARHLGIDAWGMPASGTLENKAFYEVREFFAKTKDFLSFKMQNLYE